MKMVRNASYNSKTEKIDSISQLSMLPSCSLWRNLWGY